MKEQTGRNDRILIAVLRGWTLREVGSVFGITSARVGQIVRKRARRYMTEGYEYRGLRLLRRMKNTIISRIERGKDEVEVL